MKLYVEIDGAKHYIDEGVVEKYALYEGYVTPFTGLKIKMEDDKRSRKQKPLYQRQLTILTTQ
jgi:hypothetical protein